MASLLEVDCVTARWGGEQLETNWRAKDDEPDSVECRGEPSC